MPQLRAVLVMSEQLMTDVQRAVGDDDTGKRAAAIGASPG